LKILLTNEKELTRRKRNLFTEIVFLNAGVKNYLKVCQGKLPDDVGVAGHLKEALKRDPYLNRLDISVIV
jgi:hypothetical protein